MAEKELDKIIINMYTKDRLSFKQISDILNEKFPTENYYPMKVSRTLKSLGIKSRSKSDAQKEALKQGTKKHPTKGRKRTNEEKEAIASGQASFWNGLDEVEKKRKVKEFAKRAKKQWEDLSAEEQMKTLSKMKKGSIKQRKEGSKLERALITALKERGYSVIGRYKIEGGKTTEIDILVDGHYAIEVDGPTHFIPIYGQESFMRTVKKDEEKDKMITGAGFKLCRVRNKKSRITNRLLDLIIKNIEEWISNGDKLFVFSTEDF